MADRSRIGVITGLAAEAATLPEGSGFWIEVSAADPARAGLAADAMIAGGARLLVSYGLAAGLDPRLGPGALLLPDSVVAHEGGIELPDRGGVREQLHRIASFRRGEERSPPPPAPLMGDRLQVDPEVRAALGRELGVSDDGGLLVGVDRPVMHPDRKLALFVQTRAGAADMESHIVGRKAAAAGVPFVVLRVVSDPSNRAIPQAALAGLDANGRVDGAALAGALLRRPWESIDMLTLALDAAQAMRRLRRVGRRAASLLARL